MTDNMTKKSFRDAYGVLQQHAQTLREQAEPNIDDLLTIVTESVEAYRVCTERIDAVEAALKAALDGRGIAVPTAPPGSPSDRTREASMARAPAAAPVAARTSRTPPPAAANEDDDVPF